MFTEKGEPYKVELINDLPEDATISIYTQGNFTDLCAGPHILSTGIVKAPKLLSLAGAYWRGSEKNKMLCPIWCREIIFAQLAPKYGRYCDGRYLSLLDRQRCKYLRKHLH